MVATLTELLTRKFQTSRIGRARRPPHLQRALLIRVGELEGAGWLGCCGAAVDSAACDTCTAAYRGAGRLRTELQLAAMVDGAFARRKNDM